MTHTSLFAATLAALVLAAQPAQAQTLSLNNHDTASVNGSGTIGTIGGTTFLPGQNTTTTYIGTSNFATIGIFGASTFSFGAGASTTGGSGGVGSYGGGSGLQASSSGSVTITGGTIIGGPRGIGLATNGTGPVIITGGSISGGQNSDAVSAFNSSSVSINGGTFSNGQDGGGIDAIDSSVITVTGGNFVGTVNNRFSLNTTGGTINLFSLGDLPFLINGVSMNNTALAAGTSGTISGTLLDGEQLSAIFGISQGIINLNIGTPPAAAPEPSQFAAFAVGLLYLGVLALKAKKRQAV